MMFQVLHTPKIAAKKRWGTALAGLMALGLSASLFGCGGGDNNNGRATNVLYVETNEPAANANAIQAYRRASDGTLTALPGSPFLLNGSGLANPTENVGPSDADQQFAISTDHKLLFAVNSGSSTIAVMKIASDGSLTHIPGSPFPSGGVNPESLALVNNRLYVANKNVASGAGGPGTPNYTAFNVGSDGTLTSIGTVATSAAGSSAAQILPSFDGKVMFTNDFLAQAIPAPTGTLRSYKINADGTLAQNGAALTVPITPPAGTAAGFVPFYTVTQGVQVHPNQRIFYAAAPVTSSIIAYTYDTNGVLTYNSTSKTTGVLSCWLLINPAASRMYVVSTGDNSVSVMNLSNPLAPTEIQHLALKDIGPTFQFIPIIPNVGSSTASEEALDPSGNYLYVVSHRNTTDATFQGGNRLHVLKVAGDGTLSEPGPSIDMGTSNASNAQGMLVL